MAVATAPASADVLDVKIIARFHALRSQQKPEDLSEKDFQFLDGSWAVLYMRIKLISEAPD